MKTKTLIITALIILAVIVLGISPFISKTSPDTFPHNTTLERSIREDLSSFLYENSSGIKTITATEFPTRTDVYIKLECGKLINANEEEEIINGIADILREKYPELFPETGSNVKVEGCSQMGSSPDGIHTYYQNTKWVISQNYVDYQI